MGNFDVSPEPTPSWHTSINKWGLSWSFHIYVFGVLFVMVSLFNFISLIYHIKERKTASKRTYRCYVSINALLLFFNLPRGLILLTDPYNSNVYNLSIPQGIAFLLWGSTVPCFTSAFMLMNLALLDITKVQLYSNRLENMKLISIVIAVNFMLVLSFDFTAILKSELYWLLYICQAFFLLLGFLVAVAMLYTGIKVLRKLRQSARQVHLFDLRSEAQNEKTDLQRMERKQDNDGDVTDNSNNTETCAISIAGKASESKCREKAVKSARAVNWKSEAFRKGTFRLTVITIVTSVAAICYSLVQVYSFLSVYDVKDSSKPIDPWHWFVYQSMARFLEAVMSISVSYIVRLKDIVRLCKGPCGR